YVPPRDLHSFPTRRSSDLVNSIQLDLFEHPFSTHIQPQFKLIHNLYYYGLLDDSLPLLENPQASPQVGLSLLEMLNSIEAAIQRSEEHTSELQSRENLVCR